MFVSWLTADRLRPGRPQPSPHGWVYGVSAGSLMAGAAAGLCGYMTEYAMIREGFPAEKILYYRGGMLDWDTLGLTTVEGDL